METDKGDWEGPNGTKQLFQDAQELYGQTQDVEAVEECVRLRNEMQEIYKNAEEKASSLIKAYTDRVEELKRKAEEFAAIPASTPQIEALKKQIQESMDNIKKYQEDRESTEKAVEGKE